MSVVTPLPGPRAQLRLTARVACHLIAGLAVSVLVALACVAFPAVWRAIVPSPTPGVTYINTDGIVLHGDGVLSGERWRLYSWNKIRSDQTWAVFLGADDGRPSTQPLSGRALQQMKNLLSDNPVGLTDLLVPDHSSVSQTCYGWPFRALSSRTLMLRSTRVDDHHRRAMAAARIDPATAGPPMIVERVGGWWDPTGLIAPHQVWPATPLWPGLIANTFFWALVFASPLLVRRVNNLRRQRLRRRAGLCPTCAYNLAGLTPGTPCPECSTSLATGASSGSARVPTRGQV